MKTTEIQSSLKVAARRARQYKEENFWNEEDQRDKSDAGSISTVSVLVTMFIIFLSVFAFLSLCAYGVFRLVEWIVNLF